MTTKYTRTNHTSLLLLLLQLASFFSLGQSSLRGLAVDGGRPDRLSIGMGGAAGRLVDTEDESTTVDGTLLSFTDDCGGVNGASCETSDECCSGRCHFSTKTCFGNTEEPAGRPNRISTGMGGAGGGFTVSIGSQESNSIGSVRGIVRNFP